MENINFLKQILMSRSEYWVVAKKCEATNRGEYVRLTDDILFISIPQNIRRGLKYEDVTLKDLDTLVNSSCDQNIYLTGKYPPFQLNQTFYHFYKGYPIKRDIKQFIIAALSSKSTDILDYKPE